jgi:hypothetical protein
MLRSETSYRPDRVDPSCLGLQAFALTMLVVLCNKSYIDGIG